MDAERFDRLVRLLSGGMPRRRALQAALLGGIGRAALPRLATASTGAVLTGCRPAVMDLPFPRPTLIAPYRAVRKGESVPDDHACTLATKPPPRHKCAQATATVGRTSTISGGYANSGGGDTHSDDYFNEYYAVDFAAGGSFPVLAAADGVLERFDEMGSTGDKAVTLWITHNGSWKTKYTHLSCSGLLDNIQNTSESTPGDQQTYSVTVKAGQQIGWSGCTGATAIHLHFELRGGDAANHTSYPSDPNNLYGNGDCCQRHNCNWSYPVPELGVPDPPKTTPAACPGACSPAPAVKPTVKPAIKPGGLWDAPENGATISISPLHIEAQAYPTTLGDPKIQRVNFTGWWADLGPRSGPWKVFCSPTSPDHGDVYSCDADLTDVPPGPVAISFDVYDTAANRNLAPNGTHEIMWSPDSGCPNGQIQCDEECFDPNTSHDHCGRCDNECGIFGICCTGVCGCDETSIIPFYCYGATVLCAPAG